MWLNSERVYDFGRTGRMTPLQVSHSNVEASKDILKLETSGCCVIGVHVTTPFLVLSKLGEIALREDALFTHDGVDLEMCKSISHHIKLAHDVSDVSGELSYVGKVSCLFDEGNGQRGFQELLSKVCDLCIVGKVFVPKNAWNIW